MKHSKILHLNWQAAVSEVNQMTSLLVRCKIALYTVNRLKVYIEFLHQLSTTLIWINFQTVIIELYVYILEFLTHVFQIYQTSTSYCALHAFWTKRDIVDFEKRCNELRVRVEIKASNCNCTLSAQDWEWIEKLKQDLQRVLKKLKQSHQLQELLNQLETKIDLNKLLYVKGAMYNFYRDNYIICHSVTWVDLLHEIYDWAQHSHSKSIFWLSSWASIDKLTISWTVTEWLAHQGNLIGIDLDVSFFFKHSEGNWGSASQFFLIITCELVLKISGLNALITEVITQNLLIFDKLLDEQFNKLIYQLLHQVKFIANSSSTFIVIVNALDECEKEWDMKAIINLWSQLAHLITVCLKLLLTNQPELPI